MGAHVENILKDFGWQSIDEWCGSYVHTDGSILIVYVDDLLMLANDINMDRRWVELAGRIDFKEVAQPIVRYLGAQYQFTPYDQSNPTATRYLRIGMVDYACAHSVSIGVLHECIHGEEMAASMQHCPTKRMEAERFTEALVPATFGAFVDMCGCRRT